MEEVMRSRYMKYSFCMERGLNWKEGGQGERSWLKGHNVDAAMNKWGTTEPTQRGIDSASPQVKKLDADCRRQNEIAGQPRPR